MRIASLVLILLLAFTVSCGPTITRGKWIDEEKRTEIINGQTTSNRVVELFGQPDKIETIPSGGEKYTYQYYREEYEHWYTLPKYEKQDLEVFLKDGMVQEYVFTREYRGKITMKDLRE
jgi:hypothetical protein